MPGMKRDCGGAAGILGAFKAAVSKTALLILNTKKLVSKGDGQWTLYREL